jgi:hypothetical protein
MNCTFKCVENDVQMLGCDKFYFFKGMMGDDGLTFIFKWQWWMLKKITTHVKKDDEECW